MPPTEPKPLRVLLTGYGSFARTLNNPSWLAVKDLNGTLLHRSSPPSSAKHRPGYPAIHITSFEIPVVYTSVLDIVPPLHSRPPQLPPPESIRIPVVDPGLPPPSDGYDFIMHVGLGGRGGLCLEKRGRKEGYNIPDVEGKLAPIITSFEDNAGSRRSQKPVSEAVRFEAERVNGALGSSAPNDPGKLDRRGFAKGYEGFPEEFWSTLNVDKIVSHVKSSTGIEKVKPSEDAGLYLCEFINYCAMAESRRPRTSAGKKTEVLFVHVPPIGEDLTLEEMTKGLTSIVEYVCWESGSVDVGS